MLMDINTLATIQQDRHQELIRLAERQRLTQVRSDNSQPPTKATAGKPETTTKVSLQEKLFTMFQMRIRAVLPR